MNAIEHSLYLIDIHDRQQMRRATVGSNNRVNHLRHHLLTVFQKPVEVCPKLFEWLEPL